MRQLRGNPSILVIWGLEEYSLNVQRVESCPETDGLFQDELSIPFGVL